VSEWRRNPTIYEINTWVWLNEVASKYGIKADLALVPAAEWDAIAALGFDAVWFMGVWERSPAGIAISNKNAQLQQDFRRALADFRSQDNVGSAYCVHRYVVDSHLGGRSGLARARSELAKRGLKLVLDFVPNHVATDNPWVKEHPEYFVQGTENEIKSDPQLYLQTGGSVFAYGRDPYFPPWQDVLQLNAFHPGLRRAAIETLSSIGQQCDGVRCDMSMLLLSSIFERTWGKRAGEPLTTDYWREVIPSVKRAYPNFLFVAEAYWDLEWELQQQGFDYCYDKRLYDRLQHDNAESVRLHLCADMAYQSKLLRFLENHDEPRAAAAFLRAKEQAGAVVIAKLFYEGQFEGRKVRPPVFLARRPAEPADPGLMQFYRTLLAATKKPVFHDGNWSLCERSGWPDNPSYQNIVAWTWQDDRGRLLIATNLSDSPAEARITVNWPNVAVGKWLLHDLFSDAKYDRDGQELSHEGLYVSLPAWGFHFLDCTPETAATETPQSTATAVAAGRTIRQ
jgi:Alpha amylase, catalytic domain